MAIHTWKKEDLKVVAKKVVEALPTLPKGSTIVSSNLDGRMIGAWCVYETEHPEEVKKYLDGRVPEMTTEMVPLIQFFPPSGDIYKLIHVLAGM